MKIEYLNLHFQFPFSNPRSMTKKIILSALFSGAVYASLMAGFDYSGDEEFSLNSFSINFIFFGVFMGLMTRFNLKRQERQSKNNQN